MDYLVHPTMYLYSLLQQGEVENRRLEELLQLNQILCLHLQGRKLLSEVLLHLLCLWRRAVMPQAPARAEARPQGGEDLPKTGEILGDDVPLGLDAGANSLLPQGHTLLQVAPPGGRCTHLIIFLCKFCMKC